MVHTVKVLLITIFLLRPFLVTFNKKQQKTMKLNNIKGHRGGNRGRPPTKPAVLKDGFYIEVRNRATDPGTGVKIWKGTEEEMDEAAAEYRKTKLVIILGAYKNGAPVNQVLKKKKAA